MRDQYNREINYVRISITDRCNLRCRYCMPDNFVFLKHEDIMRYEEILSFVELLAKIGISAIKITGGEPLVRKGCAGLIKDIKKIPGIDNVTLTTNGVLLTKHLPDLLAAGLDAVNISLDTLDPVRYQEITGIDAFAAAWAGMEAAVKAGLKTKINCVVMEESDAWLEMVSLARETKVDVRFIELMPIGIAQKSKQSTNGKKDIIDIFLKTYSNAKMDERKHGNGPAQYYTMDGYLGSIGFISAMNHKFCESCNRIRLTSTGILKNCLCFGEGKDIRSILRQDTNEADKIRLIKEAIYLKPKEHRFLFKEEITENRNMSSIGG